MSAQRKKPVLASPPSVGDLRAALVKRGVVAPLLSVVVPVKNEEQGILPFVKRVGAILDSIAAKQGWEILFIDDGSTDATPQLTAVPRDRVQVLRHETRLGEGAALKSGLAVARYPLLFYTVCDPAYRPADFKRLLAEIDKVHLISGYRAARQVPLLPRLFGAVLSFVSRIALMAA